MNRLPEVKSFIYNDLPLFHNVVFKGVPGANPDLLLLDGDGETIERIDLGKYDREGCNQLLIEKGFWKKHRGDEDAPEEYRNGPYVPVEKRKEMGLDPPEDETDPGDMIDDEMPMDEEPVGEEPRDEL